MIFDGVLIVFGFHGFPWRLYWVLVRGFVLSYHKKETVLFTRDPHYGNLNIESLNKNPV